MTFKFVLFKLVIVLFSLTSTECSVEESFKQYCVVPDVIPVAPLSLATVTYPSGVSVHEGNKLEPTDLIAAPTVTWDASPNDYYFLAMVDPDVPSRETPLLKEIAHWLVSNICGTNIEEGDTIADYLLPTPPPGSGPHRYVFLVYKQPGIVDTSLLSDVLVQGRARFSITKFADKYNLTVPPVAGNFFTSGISLDVDLDISSVIL